MATRSAIRHGEILLLPVDSIPGFRRVEQVTSCIVGHSESGHHHVLECDEVFEQIRAGARGERFVDLPCAARLRQEKTDQPHRELAVPAGRWKVIRKTEFDVRAAVASRRAVCD
jgi:hypothetical protein